MSAADRVHVSITTSPWSGPSLGVNVTPRGVLPPAADGPKAVERVPVSMRAETPPALAGPDQDIPRVAGSATAAGLERDDAGLEGSDRSREALDPVAQAVAQADLAAREVLDRVAQADLAAREVRQNATEILVRLGHAHGPHSSAVEAAGAATPAVEHTVGARASVRGEPAAHTDLTPSRDRTRRGGIAAGRGLLFVAAVWLITAGLALAAFAPRPGGAPTGVHLVAVPVLVLAGAALIDRIRSDR